MPKPVATIEKQLILKFDLPGVDWNSYSSHSASADRTQLEKDRLHGEHWHLKVAASNVRETVTCLRAVIEELEKFAQAEGL